MTHISEILADAIGMGRDDAVRSPGGRSDAPSLDRLASRLAGTISGLDPSLRLLIAQRVIAYAGDLLVRPLSPAGGQLLDEAVDKLRRLTSCHPTVAANDQH